MAYQKKGRKSKWHLIEAAIESGEIQQWLSDGLWEKDIAANLGMSVATWESWKSKKPELREVIKKGNETIVRKVENALAKKALGFRYTEKKITVDTREDGTQTTREEITEKYSSPDTGAAIFILKNKDREHWKNDPEIARLREKELKLRERVAEGRGELWD